MNFGDGVGWIRRQWIIAYWIDLIWVLYGSPKEQSWEHLGALRSGQGL